MKKSYYDKLRTQGYYIIAEVGVNYYEIAEINKISPLEAAKLMIKKTKEAGADAVKFQTYKAEKLTMVDSPGSWDRKDIAIDTMYELFQLYDKLEAKEYKILSDYAKELQIDFMSTPFDYESADYLDDMMDVYKISSSDISNFPFIEHIAKKGKPIILSVGASDLDEIEQAVELITSINTNKITLLHCVLEYPTPYDHANLNKIVSLRNQYPNAIIGYSDHTKPDKHMDILKSAYLLGAEVIEKHFTLDKTIKKKNDHFHSMDFNDLKQIKEGLELINTIKGSGEIKCLESEKITRQSVRRSAISACEIHKGDILTEQHVIYKRPGTGLSPQQVKLLFGKKAVCDIKSDSILEERYFK